MPPWRIPLLAALLVLFAAPPAHAGLSTWTSLPGLTAGSGAQHIRAFAYDNVPPTTVYAATDDQGVFRSLNGGISWSPFNNGLDNLQAKTVRALVVDGTTVYAGTNLGVFTSEAGSAWEPLAQGTEQNPAQPKNLNEPVQSLIALPGNIILAGVFSGGVYKSTDGGETWTHPPPGNGMPAHQTVTGLSAHPFTAGLVYAASGTGIFRSTNSGSTWTLASDGIPGGGQPNLLWVDKSRPNIYYTGTAASGVYRSINAGVTWSEINDGLGAVRARGLEIFTNPTGAVLYAATEDALWAGETRGSAPPTQPKWRRVTTNGLVEPGASNTIMWALTAPVFPAGPDRTLFAGTGSNGGYAITLQRPDNPCVTPPSTDTSCPDTLDQTPVEGQVLQAVRGTQWSGTETIDFAFAWQSCPATPANPGQNDCTDIDNQTDDTYVVTEDDDAADRRFRIKITATNSFPTLTEVKRYSAATGPAGPNPANFPGSGNTYPPDVDVLPPGSGNSPTVGDTLHADEGKTPDPPTDDGWFQPPATTRAYQWLRCKDFSDNDCTEVPGATGRDYVLAGDDGQHSMRVRITGTNASGTNQLLSPGTFLVISEQATPTQAPAIFGDAYPGETLVGTVGAWKDPTTGYHRLWLRCDANGDFCTDIQAIPSGDPETTPSYTVRDGDVGYTLKMRVTADVNGDSDDGQNNELPSAFETHTPPSAVVSLRPGSEGSSPGGDGGLGPGGGGVGGAADTISPALTALSLTNKRFAVGSKATATTAGRRRTPKGTTFRFRLSEPATATLAIDRMLPGRKVGRKCKAPSRKLRKKKKCTRAKRAGTLTRRNLPAGAAAVAFSGRIGKKKLAPGSYQVKVMGTDAAGNKSRTATARFTIVRR